MSRNILCAAFFIVMLTITMTNVSMLSVVVPFWGNKNESLASREKIKQKGFWQLRKKFLVNDG
jgi:hypothetical protein